MLGQRGVLGLLRQDVGFGVHLRQGSGSGSGSGVRGFGFGLGLEPRMHGHERREQLGAIELSDAP